MKKVMSEEKKARRPDLIEYDRSNVSPHFTTEMIQFRESRQQGLSARDHAKLDEIEFFILNLNSGGFVSCAVPGLRANPLTEVRYLKRFNKERIEIMMSKFMGYVPHDFPSDQIDRCYFKAFRLKTPDGGKFYPITYNGNLPAWRKRLDDNAAFFKTLIGRFENGKFVLSDGQRIEFADMEVEWVGDEALPRDF